MKRWRPGARVPTSLTPPPRRSYDRGCSAASLACSCWTNSGRRPARKLPCLPAIPSPLSGCPRLCQALAWAGFHIRRELGRGGFGIVFLAHDPLVGREVALKVPRAEALATADQRRRFQLEAQAAGRLDHPNIVPLYEAGEAGSVCYIASAFCPGITLAAWRQQHAAAVPRGAWPPR